jgi:hypothetical protein
VREDARWKLSSGSDEETNADGTQVGGASSGHIFIFDKRTRSVVPLSAKPRSPGADSTHQHARHHRAALAARTPQSAPAQRGAHAARRGSARPSLSACATARQVAVISQTRSAHTQGSVGTKRTALHANLKAVTRVPVLAPSDRHVWLQASDFLSNQMSSSTARPTPASAGCAGCGQEAVGSIPRQPLIDSVADQLARRHAHRQARLRCGSYDQHPAVSVHYDSGVVGHKGACVSTVQVDTTVTVRASCPVSGAVVAEWFVPVPKLRSAQLCDIQMLKHCSQTDSPCEVNAVRQEAASSNELRPRMTGQLWDGQVSEPACWYAVNRYQAMM